MQHDVALLMHLRSFKVLQVEPFIAFFFYRNLCKLHIQFEIPTDSGLFFLFLEIMIWKGHVWVPITL